MNQITLIVILTISLVVIATLVILVFVLRDRNIDIDDIPLIGDLPIDETKFIVNIPENVESVCMPININPKDSYPDCEFEELGKCGKNNIGIEYSMECK